MSGKEGSEMRPGESAQKGAGEGQVTAGKYYLIEVPNFNDTGEGGGGEEPMTSYLRLGAVKDVSIAGKTSAPRASGEDLAALVTDFIDDTRKRDGCDSTGEFTFTPEAQRMEESSKLHTKGGWRDHSDGNRITTTRGDKIEVIRGNYKMVVLGRTDNLEEAASVDMSGGHLMEGGITLRGMSSIEWVQTYDGTWKMIETSERGDINSTYHGDTREFYYGLIKESTTGTEQPAEGRENPRIVDRTWAESIASYTGSEARRVPSITEERWAEVITSLTDATNITDTTNVSGAITSTTTVGSITDSTTVSGAMTSTTEVSGDITEETRASSITSTTTAGSITDTTTGDVTSTTTGDVSDTVTGDSLSVIMGSETEIIMGACTEVEMGAVTSLTLGLITDIALGLMINVSVGGTIEVNGEYKIKTIGGPEVTTAAVNTRIASIHTFLGKLIAG